MAFRKPLDASMAHFLKPLLLSLNPPPAWLDAAKDTLHPQLLTATPPPRIS